MAGAGGVPKLVAPEVEIVDLRAIYSGVYPTRSLAQITHVVLHHSGNAYNSDPAGIDAYHKSLGWSGFGYHYLVRQEGTVYYVGDVETSRANVKYLNDRVVGIILSGDFTNEPPGALQLMGAEVSIRHALGEIGRRVAILGHREIAVPSSPTACPGDTYQTWLPALKAIGT